MMGGRQVLVALCVVASCTVSLQLGVYTARAALPWGQIQRFGELHTPRAQPPSVVRLYFMPTAPVKLKWGTPRQLLLTTIEATALNRSHPIGHVAVEVQCRGLDDPEHHVFTGASDLQSGAGRQLLLKDELAFSILERAWPGVLETEADLAKSVVDRTRSRDRLAVASFLISDESAGRLLDYHRALQADTHPRYYGFGARPRRGEGSGCSAFGASFLEQIGLLDASLRAAWSQSVRVPLSLMAGYLGHPRIKVAVALISHAAAAWASPGDPHMRLEFFDPDLMFQWTLRLHASGGDLHGLPVQPDPELPRALDRRYHLDGLAARNVKAILVDAREVPTPTGPIFTGAPALSPMSDTSIPTVIRSDKVVSPNGSFEIRP